MKKSYRKILCAMSIIATLPLSSLSAQTPKLRQNLDKNSAFIKDLEKRTFLWFWENANPKNGLVPDRTPADPKMASIASIGFGLTAYGIGVERHYITRQEAAQRTLMTLRFLTRLPQGPQEENIAGYHGFFYHFLNDKTGMRFNHEIELSTIDTALLLGGVLFAQSYYDHQNATEKEIRLLSEKLYENVDWTWMVNRHKENLISMGWFPQSGFINLSWKGYNEGALLYLLALSSPHHAVSQEVWQNWRKTTESAWKKFGNQKEFLNFSPLFGHQYSESWIDFRSLEDDSGRAHHMDFFQNGRLATYAQRDYALRNPSSWKGYGENLWGLTACDGPGNITQKDETGRERHFMSYSARGAGADYISDDGTIAPTAAGGSIAFAPEIVVPALEYMKNHYGDRIYNQYGFVDAFNPTYQENGHYWVDRQQLGIDQGPILLMIENWRTGFVWRIMKKNHHLQEGLKKAGFRRVDVKK